MIKSNFIEINLLPEMRDYLLPKLTSGNVIPAKNKPIGESLMKKHAINIELSETKRMQIKYWTAFNEYLKQSNSSLRSNQEANPFSWHAIAMEIGWAHLEATISTRDNTGRVELRIKSKDALAVLLKLKTEQAEAERAIGKLIWEEMPNNLLKKVYMGRDAFLFDTTKWESQFKWYKENLEKMNNYFQPKLKAL